MIQLYSGTSSQVVIFKSSFNYEVGNTYSIKLTNDIEKSIQYTNLIIEDDTSQYSSFILIDKVGPSASLGEIDLSFNGFYTMDILEDSNILYTERCQVDNRYQIDYPVINDELVFITYDDYGTFSVYEYPN